MVNEAQNDWDTKLDSILFAYRASKHRSTGYSPFYMMYHREPRLPVCKNVGCDVENALMEVKSDLANTDEFIQKMLNRQEDVMKEAKKSIAKAQKEQKDGYDKRHIPEVHIIIHACI